MRNVVFILVVTLLLIGGCSSHDSSFRPGYNFGGVDKVAIVAIEGAVRSEAARDQIADFFMMELLKKGYAPVERAQVKALLKEQEFQSNNLTASESAIEAGLILNVPAVFIISIPHFNEDITMTAKLMDVEDGSILWMGTGSGKARRNVVSIFGFGKGDDSGVDSENEEFLAMTGALEGISEKALSPREAKRTNSIARKICRSLPQKPGDQW